ncbi:G-type lectin S-receptor-like serine/threonine-protein kinase At1g61390 [Linum grandiflorum]
MDISIFAAAARCNASSAVGEFKRRLVLRYENKLRCWDRIRGWYLRFETPMSECEVYGASGKNGVCGWDDLLKCECVRGFVPDSEEEWKVGNWSRGCVRRTEFLMGF